MFLSDRSIREALESGRIEIEPLDWKCIQPSSVDLHLSSEFRVFKNMHNAFIDPRDKNRDYTELVKIAEGEPFVLHPHEFVLGCLVERVRLPADLFGLLGGKSSLGRLGIIIHATAGKVDPGWNGRLTLELSNVGKIPVALYPGMGIAQLSFGELTTPADKAYGHKELGSKYQDANEPGESRVTRKEGE
ncbi:MAG: dCTP deaminase [Candidatus Micrarchaeia archaeon]